MILWCIPYKSNCFNAEDRTYIYLCTNANADRCSVQEILCTNTDIVVGEGTHFRSKCYVWWKPAKIYCDAIICYTVWCNCHILNRTKKRLFTQTCKNIKFYYNNLAIKFYCACTTLTRLMEMNDIWLTPVTSNILIIGTNLIENGISHILLAQLLTWTYLDK